MSLLRCSHIRAKANMGGVCLPQASHLGAPVGVVGYSLLHDGQSDFREVYSQFMPIYLLSHIVVPKSLPSQDRVALLAFI